MKKNNKECVIQCRCTKNERNRLKKLASDMSMSFSDCIRFMLFQDDIEMNKIVRFMVQAQELKNYIDKNYSSSDEKLRKKVDELWEIL